MAEFNKKDFNRKQTFMALLTTVLLIVGIISFIIGCATIDNFSTDSDLNDQQNGGDIIDPDNGGGDVIDPDNGGSDVVDPDNGGNNGGETVPAVSPFEGVDLTDINAIKTALIDNLIAGKVFMCSYMDSRDYYATEPTFRYAIDSKGYYIMEHEKDRAICVYKDATTYDLYESNCYKELSHRTSDDAVRLTTDKNYISERAKSILLARDIETYTYEADGTFTNNGRTLVVDENGITIKSSNDDVVFDLRLTAGDTITAAVPTTYSEENIAGITEQSTSKDVINAVRNLIQTKENYAIVITQDGVSIDCAINYGEMYIKDPIDGVSKTFDDLIDGISYAEWKNNEWVLDNSKAMTRQEYDELYSQLKNSPLSLLDLIKDMPSVDYDETVDGYNYSAFGIVVRYNRYSLEIEMNAEGSVTSIKVESIGCIR